MMFWKVEGLSFPTVLKLFKSDHKKSKKESQTSKKGKPEFFFPKSALQAGISDRSSDPDSDVVELDTLQNSGDDVAELK